MCRVSVYASAQEGFEAGGELLLVLGGFGFCGGADGDVELQLRLGAGGTDDDGRAALEAVFENVRRREAVDSGRVVDALFDLFSPRASTPPRSARMISCIRAKPAAPSNSYECSVLRQYAGMSPSTYQSGQLKNCYPHMEKRGSRYLRYALYNATKYVCHWDPTFAAYLAKKRAEGKHYNVALSHATKKLVRLIFAMEKSRQPYRLVA